MAPTVVLKVTDATGNVTPVTLVGGSLFFDATGSADSDGTLSEVAIVAFDGNRSYSASLYSAGVFHVVNFTFDRAGPVNVTVSALDNRNAIGQMDTNVYVNKLMPVGPTSPPRLPYPPAVGPIPAADSCEPIDEEGLQDQQFVGSGTFDADVNTTYVTAHKTSGVDLQMVLCTPNVPGPSAPICPLGDDNADVRSDPGTIFVTPPGANKYILRLVAQQANPTGDLFTADVIIHYEPDPMAAAPAA